MKQPSNNEISYKAGHPWYYRLGGRVLYPSEIKTKVDIDNYSTLMIEDVLAGAKMAEPKRSERLRVIRLKIRADLNRDLKRYLECVRELKARRLDPNPEEQSIVSCVYMAMSLKHNHLYNRYAQLMICEKHLSQQADLFALL